MVDGVIRRKSVMNKVGNKHLLFLSLGHYRSPLWLVSSFIMVGYTVHSFPDFIVDIIATCEVYNWIFSRFLLSRAAFMW